MRNPSVKRAVTAAGQRSKAALPSVVAKPKVLERRPYRRRTVTVVNRAYSRDPRERIATIGGVVDGAPWQLSQEAAIAAIQSGTDEFFVASPTGPVKVVVATHAGQKYLQSEREKTHPDDLLALCALGLAKQATLQSR